MKQSFKDFGIFTNYTQPLYEVIIIMNVSNQRWILEKAPAYSFNKEETYMNKCKTYQMIFEPKVLTVFLRNSLQKDISHVLHVVDIKRLILPPASRTRYFVPALNLASDNFVDFSPTCLSTGRWRQYKEAASGSNAIVSWQPEIPA